MKSNDRGIRFRAFGQRLIGQLSSSKSPTSGLVKGSGGSSRISLSDFLDRKLQKAPLRAGTVQSKAKPFVTLLKPEDRVLYNHDQNEDKNGGKEEKPKDVDQAIFQQFKLTNTLKENCAASCNLMPEERVDVQVDSEVAETRKRKNPFQDIVEGRQNSKRHVVVLGKGPEPKKARRKESSTMNMKPRTEYNHYENGGGFWDSSMLGIDNDEVGFSEIWEGVGSTNLGGIEWH